VDACIVRDADDIELKQVDESITVVETAFGSFAASQRRLPTAVKQNDGGTDGKRDDKGSERVTRGNLRSKYSPTKYSAIDSLSTLYGGELDSRGSNSLNIKTLLLNITSQIHEC